MDMMLWAWKRAQCSPWLCYELSGIWEERNSPHLDSSWLVQGTQNRAQFSNWLCYELSGVCKTKPPPLAKGRKPGPAFQAVDPKEAEMEKMLAGMKVAHTPQSGTCVCPGNPVLCTHALGHS